MRMEFVFQCVAFFLKRYTMKNRYVLTFVLTVLMVSATTLVGQTNGDEQQEQAEDQEMEELARMPVNVDELAEKGVPQSAIGRLTNALNRADVSPEETNDVLESSIQADETPDVTGVGTFVEQQIEEGLTGDELAGAIHQHLNTEYGIPAGGNEQDGPPAVAENGSTQGVQDAPNAQTPVNLNEPHALGATDVPNPNAEQGLQRKPARVGKPSTLPPSRAAQRGKPANRGKPEQVGKPSNLPPTGTGRPNGQRTITEPVPSDPSNPGASATSPSRGPGNLPAPAAGKGKGRPGQGVGR